MMKKAVIYGRQSSGDDDFSESVDLQLKKCTELASKEGLEVIGVFYDNNASGKLYPQGSEAVAELDLVFKAWYAEQTKTKKYREGLGELIKRLDEVDFIIVYDLTRLYRPVTGSFLESYMHQLLTTHKVKVLTLTGVVDFGSFNDSLITALQNRVNNEQIRTQIEKSKAALKKMKDNGDFHTGLARKWGFKMTGRKYEVELVQEESKMIKDIFKLFNNAVALNDIVKRINTAYTHILEKPLYRQVIRNILLSPLYCGFMEDSQGELVKCKALVGKEIVSLNDWLKAKRKLDMQKIFKARPKKRWLPLSPYIYCGHCGAKMLEHGGTNGYAAFYMCDRYQRDGGEKCRNTLALTRDIKEGIGIMEAVKPLLLAEAIKRMKESKDDTELKEKLSKAELVISEAKRKTKKLTDLWLQGLMEEEVYESSVKELKEKISMNERQRDRIEAELTRDVSEFEWVKLMMKFRGDALTQGDYETLTNVMIKKIVIYRDFVDVKTTFGDVSIPRQHIGLYRLLCNYMLEMKKQKAAIYFYKGKARMLKKEELESFEKIAVLGELEVFQEK